MTVKEKPKPYQKEGVLFFEKHNGRALCADQTGLGKTLQDILYVLRNKTYPALVICPATAKYTWQREYHKWGGKRAMVLEGTVPSKISRLHRPDILIINFDILKYWVDELRKINLESITIDESHFLINHEAQRTAAVYKICEGVQHIRALSATPLVNRPIELFPTLQLLWPKEFPSRVAFGYRYSYPTNQYGKTKFKGARRKKELHKRLKKCGMIRRKKRDVLKELPPLTREVVPLPIHDPKGEYAHASRDFIGWLATKDTAKARRASRAEAVVKVGYLKRLAARLKYKYVKAWIDNFLKLNEEKLAVFAWHTDFIKNLHKRYKQHSVVVTGSTTAKKRDEAVWAFQHNKNYDLFLGNIVAASTNITLTAAATIAIAELSYRPGDCIQLEGRIDRISQTQPTTAVYLVAQGTIEEKICNILQIKQEDIDAILDGQGDVNDLDIFDLLLDTLHEAA